jgi:deoxyribodipyrimidine photolyase
VTVVKSLAQATAGHRRLSPRQVWHAARFAAAERPRLLGKAYPRPIVDHEAGRERALAAYAKIRNAKVA